MMRSLCMVDGCNAPVKAKNLCNKHYIRLQRYGRLEKLTYPKICSVEGCERPVKAMGLCNLHWQRQWKHGSTDVVAFIKGDDEARFFSHVNKNGPIPEHNPELGKCWLWTGSLTDDGYGEFYCKGKTVKAYRWLYEREIGEVSEGMVLDHLCRNPACVNPLHLEPVTNRENILRGENPAAQNAKKRYCKRGHLLEGDNVYPDKKGHRNCKICARLRAKERRERNKVVR